MWVARNPPGFAFAWFEDSRDAEDAVRDMDQKEVHGQVLRVEISENRGRGGPRSGGGFGRGPPRTTGFKVRITNLPQGVDWRELKDYVRDVGDVIYTNVEGSEG